MSPQDIASFIALLETWYGPKPQDSVDVLIEQWYGFKPRNSGNIGVADTSTVATTSDSSGN